MATNGYDHATKSETDNGDHTHLGPDEDGDRALNKIRTAGSISISPALFEKIYLSPKNQVAGDIRRTFGNPTPIALGGFILSLSPLSNNLSEWRGSGGLGAANVGVFFFCGGLLMVLGGLLEFILGNTFPSVVFSTFGGFWLAYAATLTPYFNAAQAYAVPGDDGNAFNSPGFTASFGYFNLWMGLLCFIYMIAALRTNLVFVLIFAFLVPAFGCLAGADWQSTNGNFGEVDTLHHAAGGLAFACSLCGWYLFTVQVLTAVDFPIILPVGDLSAYVPGASERAGKNREVPSAAA